MRRFAFLAVVACVCGCILSGTGRADTITESFTINIGPPPATLSNFQDNFFSESVPQFNPANGTLTSVSVSLTGSGTWTSTSAFPDMLVFGAVQKNDITIPQDFGTPGTTTISLSGSSTDSGILGSVTGTGLVTAGLDLNPLCDSTNTFETVSPGLSGTLTYTFTPTPEPASVTLFGIGAVGALGYAWRKRRRAAA
jgi:hypothetical protein